MEYALHDKAGMIDDEAKAEWSRFREECGRSNSDMV